MAEALTDDLVEEILLRLAPDDPASLVRAAAVCLRWRRVASTPGFRRGFARRHRTAPMLGFIANLRDGSRRHRNDYVARFVPATAFRPRRADRRGRRALDARHGRVLLDSLRGKPGLEVWDPVTDEVWVLPDAPPLSPFGWNATVLCAAHGACDHLDCRSGPFLVVLLDCGPETMHVYIYSSEAGAWSGPTYGPPCPLHGVEMAPTALVGNALHFLVGGTNSMFKYDLVARSSAVISLPHGPIPISLPPGFISCLAALTTTEDGGLGFARVEVSTLGLWSIETCDEGHVLWALNRSIRLPTLLGVDGYVGFAHGVGVIFVDKEDASFSIDLKSGKVRVEDCGDGHTHGVVPYMSFYSPEFCQYGLPPV